MAALPLVALAAAFAAGAVLDLSRWREAFAARAAAAIGRPLQLQGVLQLQLGRELVLRAGGIRVPGAPGFGTPQFVIVDDARLRVDLLDLLRGRLRLRGIEARDIGLWLERAADGRGNWGEAPTRDAAAAPADIGIGPIVLKRVAIHVHDARSATRHTVDLETLYLQATPGQPVHLTLRGRDALGAPYRLELDGGGLRPLLERTTPWPFALRLHAPALRLHAGGTLDAARGEARFDVDAHVDDLARAGRPWGAALPPGVAAALRGRVAVTAQAADMELVAGRLAETGLSGRLRLELAAARPRLQGRLQVDALDLRALRAGDPTDPPAGIDDMLRQPVPRLERLPLDLDLGVQLQRWDGPPVALRDLALQLQADTRGLRATLAGAGLSGRLQLDATTPSPQLAAQWVAEDLAFGSAAPGEPDAPRLEGRLRQAELRLSGRGDTWGAMLRELELSLAGTGLRLQHRSTGDARPVTVAIDRLALAAGRGEALRGSASGTLNGERARLLMNSASLADLLRLQALPLDAELALAPGTLRIATVIAPQATAQDIDVQLQAPRSGDLSRWLPVSPQSSLPLQLRARVHTAGEGWALQGATLQLGRSDLQIDAQQRRVDGRLLTAATVRSRLIDAAQLSTLRAGLPASAGGALHLPDADLDLQLQRVLFGHTELHDVALAARTREGRLLPVAASGRMAGATFTAQAGIDAGDPPRARLELDTGAIDLGALLRGLGVAQDIDGQADSLRLSVVARGSSLAEWAQHTDFDARLGSGRLSVQGPAQRPAAEIGVKLAFVGAAAGAPIRGQLVGTVDELPLRIDLATGSFADFARDASRLPFTMSARAAGSRLRLDGEVALPLGSDGQLMVELGGERLDTLNGLARAELPPWGPWSLRGPIRMTTVGYELPDLRLDVGQSRMGGQARLDLGGPRPQLQMEVAADRIQLDDFPPPQRLIDDAGTDPAREATGLRASAGRVAGQADRLLSARFLRRFDARIDAKAREVMSGTDRLADGHLHLALQEGRLLLDPAQVNLPGGSLRLSMGYDLKESQLDFAMSAAVQRFDYGILARRWQPDANLRGLFSLDMKIAGTAPSLDRILPRASGHLDFAVWPTELRSAAFNLWSANLVLTLLPLIDPAGSPQVNCVVGRFDLQDGRLGGETMLIDTTSVRIRGTGAADLASEQLDFVFRPRAKGVGLFRLQTPLRVGGTFYDQRFYVSDADVLESVLRMVASPVLLPIERLRYGPQRRDGADVCTDPMAVARR